MSYHPSSYHGEPPVEFASGTPDRYTAWRRVEGTAAPMRDGIILRSDLYLPEGCERAPAILVRQPYGARTPGMAFQQLGSFWARKGYACLIQDVRGKFSSDGAFDPMVNERQDGFDTVEWVAHQSWCNGKVGMWGESYYGFTSLAAAVETPPALACIAPGDIASDRHKIWFRQGAFLLNTIGPWAMAMDAPEYADTSRYNPWHLPLIDMPAAAGLEGRYFRRLVTHAMDPVWWAARGLADRLDRIKIPVLFWSGWYDNYTGGTLDDFSTLERTSPRPDDIHLFVGPWDHEASGEHTDRAGCIKLPATAKERWDTYQGFFDRYLMGVDNGFGSRGKAKYFTIGANRWQQAPSWPPPTMRVTPFYLRAGGLLSREAPGSDEPPDLYQYDPADPVADTVGLNCWALCGQLGDRRAVESRADVLTYTTTPCEDDIELTGPIEATLHAASSAVDTDFTMTLVDILEDGTANQIQDGIIRAAHRESEYQPMAIEPGRIYAYRISLAGTSYLVKKGHRIRVEISSSCFDRYDRNTNTGEPFGRATMIKVANQAIHHSPAHPSHVQLPLVIEN